MAGADRRWQEQTENGRSRQEMAGADRKWQEQTGDGWSRYKVQDLTGEGKTRQDMT